MKVAWYEKQGPAEDVLMVGEMNEPLPLAGEVRIRVAISGVNPGDVKKREDAFGVGMPYPRVISHSDGSGTVDRVGEGVSEEWICRRVWCYGAQSYRPFGTAPEYTVVPLRQVAEVPRRCRSSKGLASAFLASLRIGPFMLRVRSKDVPFLYKVALARLGPALCNLRISPEHESSLLAAPNPTKRSH